jgi:hypothetical protein
MASSSESQNYSPPYPDVLANGCQLTGDVKYTVLTKRLGNSSLIQVPYKLSLHKFSILN